MKRFFFLLIITLSINAFSYESMPYSAPYEVVSDTLDTSLSPGTCVVYGIIYLQPYTPIQNATIATLNRSSFAVSDSKGNYSLILNSEDSALFFYHPEYGEIVIWKYDFKSRHRVHINFYARSKYEENQMVKKPVIYLYSETEMNVELTLSHPNITFSFPAYTDGWKVKTNTDGSIQDMTNKKKYPYLFWEGETRDLRYQAKNGIVSGQLVRTDTLVDYFETALTAQGLNEKEQTDFITFWAPSLINKPYVFIQFLIDEEYDLLIAGLHVTPIPDSRRRIFMQFTLLESDFIPFEYSVQEFSEFKREGFTLVEWGGSEVNFRSEEN